MNKTILIIEDDPDINNMLSTLLKRNGYVSTPKQQEIPSEMQFHLIQNMLFASSRQVNDMLGIKFNDDGSLYLVRPPSVHHKPLNS